MLIVIAKQNILMELKNIKFLEKPSTYSMVKNLLYFLKIYKNLLHQDSLKKMERKMEIINVDKKFGEVLFHFFMLMFALDLL